MAESATAPGEGEGAILQASRFDALLFDLDGVVTQSMGLHALSWKQLFDDFLAGHGQATGRPQPAFDIDNDYRAYVDGKPRYEGVRSFLASRGITLPEGGPEDPPTETTVCGLGNKKNRYFHQQLTQRGVDVYRTTVDFITRARERGLKTAVVSSSKNCKLIVESVGIGHLFDTRVDGIELDRLRLPGKPAPDMFLEAGRRLGVPPARAVVFEDAISGVQAGRSGGFGMVVGIDRLGHPEELKENGADVVISDLAELTLL
jgi:beta-phosphoglucomutase family hydrolase